MRLEISSMKRKLVEDEGGAASLVPPNNAGSGGIAGIGLGPDGQPGVNRKKKLRDIVLKRLPLKNRI